MLYRGTFRPLMHCRLAAVLSSEGLGLHAARVGASLQRDAVRCFFATAGGQAGRLTTARRTVRVDRR
jgi:hypothetical protein